MRCLGASALLFLLAAGGCSDEQHKAAAAGAEPAAERITPDDVRRLPPEHVHERVREAGALLVCAYENDAAFWAAKLDGAISRKELERLAPELAADREIVFYCA